MEESARLYQDVLGLELLYGGSNARVHFLAYSGCRVSVH